MVMKLSKRHATLPIGRTARLAFEIDGARAACSKAAQVIISHKRLDESELEECARLDDALASAQRLLKAAVRNILLSRIDRRSRRTRAR
jgi:hypothetical protein